MTGTSSIPIIVAIIIVAKTRKLINRFRNSDTLNEKNAKTLEELKINPRLIFYKYLKRGIIIETNKKYFLNEQNLIDYRTKKRMIIIPIVLIIILVSILLDVTLT